MIAGAAAGVDPTPSECPPSGEGAVTPGNDRSDRDDGYVGEKLTTTGEPIKYQNGRAPSTFADRLASALDDRHPRSGGISLNANEAGAAADRDDDDPDGSRAVDRLMSAFPNPLARRPAHYMAVVPNPLLDAPGRNDADRADGRVFCRAVGDDGRAAEFDDASVRPFPTFGPQSAVSKEDSDRNVLDDGGRAQHQQPNINADEEGGGDSSSNAAMMMSVFNVFDRSQRQQRQQKNREDHDPTNKGTAMCDEATSEDSEQLECHRGQQLQERAWLKQQRPRQQHLQLQSEPQLREQRSLQDQRTALQHYTEVENLNEPEQATAPPISLHEMETWAKSLIGRWWEVFWDPGSSGKYHENGKNCVEQTGVAASNVDDDREVLQQLEQTQYLIRKTVMMQQGPMARGWVMQHPPSAAQQFWPQFLQQQIILQSIQQRQCLLQIQQPQTQQLFQQAQNEPQKKKKPQRIDLVYTTSTLGLSLFLAKGRGANYFRVLVKEQAPDAPNAGSVRPNDCIVAINGREFNLAGSDSFHTAINLLKSTRRPMMVTFERRPVSEEDPVDDPVDDPADDPANESTDDPADDPVTERVLVQAVTGQQRGKAGCGSQRPAVDAATLPPGTGTSSPWLACPDDNDHVDDLIPFDQPEKLKRRQQQRRQQQGEKKEHLSDSSDDDDEEDRDEDDIDWYDAKILSRDKQSGQFAVHFLGDEPGATYTMSLTPGVVRPSARAWARRSLGLLHCAGDLLSPDDGGDGGVSGNPQSSTDLTKDFPLLKVLRGSGDGNGAAVGGVANERMFKYRKLLAMQQFLATRLTPYHEHSNEGEEDEEARGNEDIPGPLVDSTYVKHLCDCMAEVEKTCEWLMGESVVLDVLRKIDVGKSSCGENSTMVAKVSREVLLSFLVNGARFLNRLLASDPKTNNAAAAERQQSSQAGSRGRGRKKRRVGGVAVANNHERVHNDGAFDALLSKALVSNEDSSLGRVLARLLKKPSLLNNQSSQQVLMTATLTRVLETLFERLWTPAASWIKIAQDMITGRSVQFYSFGEVDWHLQSSKTANLVLMDLSQWTDKLVAKMSRARLFEVEAWSAVRACVQPVVDRMGSAVVGVGQISYDEDDCMIALRRLQNEASTLPTSSNLIALKEGEEDYLMRNFNPLGQHLVDSSGLALPSPLTREVLDDAITVRQWVLDLNQSKLRERISFIQGIIERYVTLPQLPTPPYGGLDGSVANPSAILAANTKDIISTLSSSCHSCNHIIGNAAAKLERSVAESNARDIFPCSKKSVESALTELTRLPILSVVEEKLHIRKELIEWNEYSEQLVASDKNMKLFFHQIEALHTKLLNILDDKSDQRAEVCRKLRPNFAIADEVRAFAIADEKVICPVTGPWVRDQYKRGSEWMANYGFIVATLQSHGYSFRDDPPATEVSIKGDATPHGNLVEAKRITELLDEHDKSLKVCFPDAYRQLDSVRQRMKQWTDIICDIVLSNSLPLEERIKRLTSASCYRPRGVSINPSCSVIDLWVRVFTWRLNLQCGIKMLTNRLNTSNSQIVDAKYREMFRSVLAPLIVEGQDFLNPMESDTLHQPFLVTLRDEVLCSNRVSDARPVITKSEILMSGTLGEIVIDRILDVEMENTLDFSLHIAQRVFWMMIYQCFFESLGSDNFLGDLSDARALLSLCPGEFKATIPFPETEGDEQRLQNLIDDTESLERKSSDVLDESTSLLQADCFLHKEELRACLRKLNDVRSHFSDKNVELAVKLLENTDIKAKLDENAKALTWLASTFTYDLFDSSHGSHHRIHFNNLRDLHDRIPVNIGWKRKSLESELFRMSIKVKDLWQGAIGWRSSVASLIGMSDCESDGFENNESVVIVNLDTLKELMEGQILSKVVMPEIGTFQNIVAMAGQVKERMKKLFGEEYNTTTDVNKAQLPDGISLITNNGDCILFRFIYSELYSELQQTLRSIKEGAVQLSVMTPEKATLEWMVRILDWVESIHVVGRFNNENQLVIAIEHALEILERGHDIFYSVIYEVQLYLKGEKVGLQVFPQNFNVSVMKGCTYSLGLGLLRWAALLFNCLKSDVDKEDHWKKRVLKATDKYMAFQSEGICNQTLTFRDATAFRHNVIDLIAEVSNMIVQDEELLCSLSSLPEKMNASKLFQGCLEAERILTEEMTYLTEKEKFTNPRKIIDDRYELLGSLLCRLPSSTKNDDILEKNVDDISLFIGEPSARDKSRFFLENSLLKGVETLGLDPNETDARDFCSILAWNVEVAVYDKYQDNSSESMSNEYRDKIRSLRFNLQDPKNPVLCARVVGGNLSILDLISASTEDLASNELKLMHRQVEEEAIKNVVLSAENTNPPEGISSKLAANLCIESTTTKSLTSSISRVIETEEDHCHDGNFVSGKAINLTPAPHLTGEPNKLLASLHPPPLHRVKHEPDAPPSAAPVDAFPSPPPSPLLLPEHCFTPTAKSRSHHIASISGGDQFRITISKLKTSFTTKIAIDDSCKFKVDCFLPSSLVEKGRLTVDDFNKFIHEKTKSGRWNLVYLKLSSISGESNMKSYKRFYKEYESVGRLTMVQASDTTKIFLITPKFLRVCKCLNNVKNLSKSSTYAVVLTKEQLTKKHHEKSQI